jgi:hypothetical protein
LTLAADEETTLIAITTGGVSRSEPRPKRSSSTACRFPGDAYVINEYSVRRIREKSKCAVPLCPA